jgi:hypothetical protein
VRRQNFTDDPYGVCGIMLGMRFLPKLGCCGSLHEGAGNMKDGSVANSAASTEEPVTVEDSHFLKTIGWVSAGLGAVALGLIVGREIRERYKFNRRTPYDLYSHSGDELPDVDCGVGI